MAQLFSQKSLYWVGRHLLGASFVLSGIIGMYLSYNELSMRSYQMSYYIVTHYITGSNPVNMHPSATDLINGS